MEIMAPANAASIIISELEAIPRLRRKIITMDTTSLAPDEIPSTNGPAIGLPKKVCNRKPDTDKAPPKSKAANIRGRRICQTML